jgi:hypothetical protein
MALNPWGRPTYSSAGLVDCVVPAPPRSCPGPQGASGRMAGGEGREPADLG